MRVLVTGCYGFIGGHLVERLLREGHTVIGIDVLPKHVADADLLRALEPFEQSGQFIHPKLAHENDIRNVWAKKHGTFDVVVHLAARAGVRQSIEQPETYMASNVEGMTHMLQECVDGGNIPMVYASSSSVYGDRAEYPFSENDTLSNSSVTSPYALTKRVCEDLARLWHRLHGLSSIGLRFFTVYGPRGRRDMAPRKFLEAIASGSTITRFGDGESTFRDYTYVGDIVEFIVRSMHKVVENRNSKEGICEVYNACYGQPVTLNEFISACEHACGRKARIIEQPIHKADVRGTHGDIAKAERDLGYRAMTNVVKGLQLTADWMKQQAHS